jgi:hypothetical protein
MFRTPAVASAATARVIVAVVAEVTLTEPTLMPVPKLNVVTPVENPVPVKVTGTEAP